MWSRAILKISAAVGAILLADGLIPEGAIQTAVEAIIAAVAVLVRAPKDERRYR